MTFKFKWIAAAAGIVLVGAALAPWTFSGAAMRLEVARQLHDATGLTVTSEGRAVLALLPRPRIKIENVRINDRDGNLAIESEWLRGDLRILPMFAGRLELVSASLFAPKLSIDLDANPFAEQGAIARAMESAPTTTANDPPRATERLGIVTLINGAALLKSKSRQINMAVERLFMTIDWRSLAAPAGVNGSFDLAGEPAQFAAWFGRPAELLSGKTSDVSLRLASTALNINLNGAMTSSPRWQFDGAMTAASPNVRDLAAGLIGALPVPGRLETANLVASASIRTNSITLADLRLNLDGNSYEGALAFDGERARPLLSGTLASDNLNLSPFAEYMPDLIDSSGGWNRTRFPVPDVASIDVDLRASATRARAGRVQMREAAFSMLLNNDRAEISLTEAKVFNGVVKTRLTSQHGANGYDLRATGNLANIDATAMLSDVFHSQRLSGEMNGDFSLASEGETLGRVLRALRGEVSVTSKHGDIAGLDIEQALRRLEKRPLSVASEMRNGRTNFDIATLDLRIDNGLARIKQAQARGPGVAFDVTGSFGIPDRALDLSLQATQTGAVAATQDAGPWLSMDIKGRWDDPVLSLDTRSLITRSNAAAPLMRKSAPAETTAPRENVGESVKQP